MQKQSVVTVAAIAVLVLALAGLVCFTQLRHDNSPAAAPAAANGTTVLQTGTVDLFSGNGSEVPIYVELAVTDDEQEHGLMNRTSMAEDAGMLFVWSNDVQYDFWMENTLIPLDMIFIGSNLSVVDIHENAVPLSTEYISSSRPYRYVLEVNGGLCQADDISTGDRVQLDIGG